MPQFDHDSALTCFRGRVPASGIASGRETRSGGLASSRPSSDGDSAASAHTKLGRCGGPQGRPLWRQPTARSLGDPRVDQFGGPPKGPGRECVGDPPLRPAP